MRLLHTALLVATVAAGCTTNSRDLFASDDGGVEAAPPPSSWAPPPPDASSPAVPTRGPDPDAAPPDAALVDARAEDARVGPDAGPPPDAQPDPRNEGDGGPAPERDASTDANPADARTDPADAPSDTPRGLECPDGGDHPVELGCTGLYSDWGSRTVAAGARSYSPGVSLWSDGAEKSRWIELPPRSTIDTGDMNEWTFPVDTKLWKEFRLGGQPVETRFLWKRGQGQWFRTTYVWSEDGLDATEVTTGVPDARGGTYEIPSQAKCVSCHQGRLDGVLGFEAVSLSAPQATGLTLAELVREGLLTTPPGAPLTIPGNATESAALGWLHANCGTACHNRSPRALAGATGLFMRLDVASLASVQSTDAWTTAVGQPSNFQTSPMSGLLLIDPGNPDNSAVSFRVSVRDDQGQGFQMPPIDTHLVDDAAVTSLRAWIQAM